MNILRDAMEVEGASIILNEYETETKINKKKSESLKFIIRKGQYHGLLD